MITKEVIKAVITALVFILPAYFATDTIFNLTYIDKVACFLGNITGYILARKFIIPKVFMWLKGKTKDTKYETLLK